MKPPPIIRKPGHSAAWVAAPVLLAALLCLVILHRFDPAQHAFYPQCLFHATTGLYCSGCGGLRGLHELLHGHWLAALRLNLLVFGLAPLLVLLGLGEWRARAQGRRGPRLWSRPWFFWLLAGVGIAFGVLRNLPFPPFTLLVP
jgi:hypothetical protein